ncbi:hypothetical protein MF672_028340 [Actinomadura sp. ATCC 31491]|uniref:Alpha/beta hydrolase fold domain-containing protein n=1 Tax=Actinomadura luzonensis TaxID=2805427 RepID=A0ABT0FZ97_9ACTN|nr:hypothetical protein [Actinomadura luzonensis]MCK2217673.1 hypothetical protein [Actinomadura luzonensis]
MLRYEPVVAGLRRNPEPALLVGGGADGSWDGDVARELTRQPGVRREYVEIPGANHGLEGGGPVRSARMLADVVVAMDRFAGTL